MVSNPLFWRAQHAGLVAFYAVVLGSLCVLPGVNRLVQIAAVMAVVHLLEIPMAWRALSPRRPSLQRVILFTLLFGFTWWLPAKRGVISVA